MGTIRNPSTYSEWSPCGRYFATAITTPRLRVDNKIKVFNFVIQHFLNIKKYRPKLLFFFPIAYTTLLYL